MTEMRNSSYLIQRLEKPWGGFGPLKDNPFSFGGGKKNGGLSDEAMGLLRGIFSFDYMGAAEFEFGAVPEALNKIANTKGLEAWSFTILLSKVPEPFTLRSEPKPKPPKRGARAPIYVLAPSGWQAEVMERIVGWATGTGSFLKEHTLLPAILRPSGGGYQSRVCGWLELDNGFFFFTSEEMWKRTCTLFEVDIVGVPQVKV